MRSRWPLDGVHNAAGLVDCENEAHRVMHGVAFVASCMTRVFLHVGPFVHIVALALRPLCGPPRLPCESQGVDRQKLPLQRPQYHHIAPIHRTYWVDQAAFPQRCVLVGHRPHSGPGAILGSAPCPLQRMTHIAGPMEGVFFVVLINGVRVSPSGWMRKRVPDDHGSTTFQPD